MELARDEYAIYTLDTDHAVIELEWLDTTAGMTEADFRRAAAAANSALAVWA